MTFSNNVETEYFKVKTFQRNRIVPQTALIYRVSKCRN